MHIRTTIGAVLMLAASLGPGTLRAMAQSGGGYDLTWSSLDCGGGTSSGGSYNLGGAIGQPEAGDLAGGSYALHGGFWNGSGGQTVDVSPGDQEGSAPLVFRLHGSSPNPFATNTAIAFSLASEAAVELRVYDLAGRLVCNVLESDLGPGRHQVMWDGRDNSGRRAAHGIYMLRLRAGDFQAHRKLALVP